MTHQLVIIGGGIAAQRLIVELLGRGWAGRDITLVCGERHLPYDRVRLGEVVEGRARPADLDLAPIRWCREHGISVHLGRPAIDLDRRSRLVRLSDGTALSYDRLVLATGAEPVIPPIPGARQPHVVTYRDLDDAARLAGAGERVVVIGGGLLGIEAAASLQRRRRAVTLLHRGQHLLERQIDPEAATLLRRDLKRQELCILTGVEVARIGGGRSRRVVCTDGRSLPADLVVLATGTKPQWRLARAGGLACRRGLVVDDTLQTSDPRIFALGDCVEHRGVVHGLVQPVREQAAVLARRLLGERDALYEGTLPVASLKVEGIALAAVGELAPIPNESLIFRDPRRGVYRRLLVSGGRLRGAVLYGDLRDAAWYGDLIRRGIGIARLRGELIFGRAVVEARHGLRVVENAAEEVAEVLLAA